MNMILRKLAVFFGLPALLACQPTNKSNDNTLQSPDGSVEVKVEMSKDGFAMYRVAKDGVAVLEPSRLGVVAQEVDLSQDLKLVGVSAKQTVSDHFALKVGKQDSVHYTAHEKVFTFETPTGYRFDAIFQVSNEGVAFRYYFSSADTLKTQLVGEVTSFNLPDSAKAWLQPCADAKTSWGRCNPSYEEYYQMGVGVDTPSPYSAGWVFPALYNTGHHWVLLSECNLGENYCATRLQAQSPKGEYVIGFPQSAEVSHTGELYPEFSSAGYSPWRIMAIGTLKSVVESNLGVALAQPAMAGDFSWVKPGRSSWSWVLLKDGATNYKVQKDFIDYAADMGWEYCLVDALWDKQIGYDGMKSLADYAKSKNVSLLVWYNSAGNWNGTPQTPRDLMLVQETRLAEFNRIRQMGIVGVKIDFFGGDGLSVIRYYQDILKDAAQAGLMVNFHGCTLPRGWHRTYPNLVSMESVKGMEYVTFEQSNADQVVPHCAILPFTRNVYDPMDFTPVCFSEIPNIKRHSSNGFELALSVLFTSGVQHYAETPQGMANVPVFVKQAMMDVPVKWDESIFVDGYPGQFVVMARRSGSDWFIAGINATDSTKNLVIDLGFAKSRKGSLIGDGDDNRSWVNSELMIPEDGKLGLDIKARGGFLITIPGK